MSELNGVQRFALNVRKARASRTQKEAAKLAGMCYQSYQRYETSGCNPSMDTIERLADALGVSCLVLLKGV